MIKSLEKCGHCLGISGRHYGYCLCNVRLKLCMLMGLMLCGIIVLSFLMRKLKKTIGKRVIWMNAFVYVIFIYFYPILKCKEYGKKLRNARLLEFSNGVA